MKHGKGSIIDRLIDLLIDYLGTIIIKTSIKFLVLLLSSYYLVLYSVKTSFLVV